MDTKVIKKLRALQIYNIFLTLILGYLVIIGFGGRKVQKFGELNVRRLNIISENGTERIVLSNAERMPLPRLQGREFPRSISPAGIVFYDQTGDECGGIALVNVKGIEKTMMVFDYSNSEAIGFGKTETEDGDVDAGLVLLDKVPAEADIMKVGSVGKTRLTISNENKNVSISLRDTKGRERIILSVDSKDIAILKVLDENGETLFSIPRK